MNTTFKTSLLTGLFWLAVVCVSAQDDKTAIKAVIEKETKAHLETDNKTWMDCWAHTPYAYWSYADSAGIYQFEGWKNIEVGFTDYFLTSKPSYPKVDRRWNEIRVYGNGAYARFVQITTLNGVTKEEDEIRVLEKQNNQWKIVLVAVLRNGRKI
jgi:hypothetical protein